MKKFISFTIYNPDSYRGPLSTTMKPFLMCFIAYSLSLIPYSSFSQPSAFNAHGIGGGGAFYCPAVNPANSSEFYAVTDMSDVYHTTDGGASWSVIDFNQLTAAPLSQVQFTNNANILYCMTNDPASGNYSPVKSADGGATWNALATDPTAGNGAWYTIANPQNYNQLIVSDYSNLYFSNNGGATFGPAFYTDNSGNGAYIAGTFFDSTAIYVCTNKGLLVSVNGGTSWSGPALNGISAEDIVSFAGAKAAGTTRFYCVTQTAGNVYVGMTGQDCSSYANVYSMDYPGTWAKKITGILSGDWPMFVGATRGNINDAWLGGASGNSGYPIVLKTVNGGAQWNYVFNTTNNQNIETGYCGSGGDFGWSWPQYIFGMSVSPADSNTVLITDEGFAHKTTDGGKTWQAVYVPPADLNPAGAGTPTRRYYHTTGLENTSCWSLMWFDSLRMFAGYTDITGIRSNDGGNTWGFDYTGLKSYNTTYMFLKNPANGVVYAATSSVHDMYQSTRLQDNIIDAGTGEVMYSADTGKTFVAMHNFGKPVIWLATDPTNANRMYAAVINHAGSGSAGGIWVSNNINLNASSTWTHCTNPARTQGHPFNIKILKDGTLIATYSGRRNASGAFTDSSGVFVSANQGSSWTDVSAPGMKYWAMDLTIDPADTAQNTWYCCVYSGWGGAPNGQGGLYRTTNRGTSWTKIVNTANANTGAMSSIFSLTIDPLTKTDAYMTTETGGLWYTSNIGAASPVFTLVTSYPFRQPNRVYFNPYNNNQVWVNSFGNGMRMGSTIPTSVTPVSALNLTSKLYPNPNRGSFFLSVENIPAGSRLELYNSLGEKVYVKNVNNGINQIVINNNLNGIYIYKIVSRGGMLISEGKLVITN